MDVQKTIEHPIIAHAIRAITRFNNRLGNQFAGAITYFSVLAMVPVLMFAFSIAGMVLTEFRPDLLQALQDQVIGLLNGAPDEIQIKIAELIHSAASNWASLSLVGIVPLAYAGSGWIKNLKNAVRAQIRPEFDQAEEKSNFVLEIFKNLAVLLVMLLAIVVTFGVASLTIATADTVLGWLNLLDVRGAELLTWTVSGLASLVAGWLMFLFLFTVLPSFKPRRRALFIGALLGSVALAVLQYFTGLIVGFFLRRPAAAVFGPVLASLLFFNLFARVILMVAAWIATDNQPAVAHRWNDADKPLRERPGVVVADGRHWQEAEADRRLQEIAKADAKHNRTRLINQVKDKVPGLAADPAKEKDAFDSAVGVRLEAAALERSGVPPDPTVKPSRYAHVDGQRYFADEAPPVSGEDAARGVRRARAIGYAEGVAMGTGVGAILCAAIAARSRARRTRSS